MVLYLLTGNNFHCQDCLMGVKILFINRINIPNSEGYWDVLII